MNNDSNVTNRTNGTALDRRRRYRRRLKNQSKEKQSVSSNSGGSSISGDSSISGSGNSTSGDNNNDAGSGSRQNNVVGNDRDSVKTGRLTKLYKTELCRSFLKSNFCRYGSLCQFAHGVSDLRHRHIDEKFKTKLCSNFPHCLYKDRCQFIHDETPDQLAMMRAFGRQLFFVADEKKNEDKEDEEEEEEEDNGIKEILDNNESHDAIVLPTSLTYSIWSTPCFSIGSVGGGGGSCSSSNESSSNHTPLASPAHLRRLKVFDSIAARLSADSEPFLPNL